MFGIELVEPGTGEPDAGAAGRGAWRRRKARGLLVGKGGLYGNVLRMAPPLTLTEDEADEGLAHPASTRCEADRRRGRPA